MATMKVTAQTLHTNSSALRPLPVGGSVPWPVRPSVAESQTMPTSATDPVGLFFSNHGSAICVPHGAFFCDLIRLKFYLSIEV